MPTVVVGVDGSEGSQHALRFAAEEARLRRARLRVVLAWEYPVGTFGAGGGWVIADQELLDSFREGVEEQLASAVEAATDALAGLEVEQRALEGRAAQVLLEQAEDAALLVLGTRGHGGFVGLLLGSVSQQCAHHAPCPVTIVPPPRQ